jgi:hypothetical protein
MCRENPTWGAPSIHGELLKLGINIAESTVSKLSLLKIPYTHGEIIPASKSKTQSAVACLSW